MMVLLNAMGVAAIAILMGVIGAYLAGWEEKIYWKYIPHISAGALIAGGALIFIEYSYSIYFISIGLIGISWLYFTKFFKEKR